MKQINFKHLLASLVAVLVSVNVNAHDVEIDGIYYNLVKKAKLATVTYRGENNTSYKGEYSGSVNIPATIIYEGVTYDVTTIGDYAFDNNDITSVTIPSSVTSIGEAAFNGCSKLTSVTIPSDVTSIGRRAFQFCISLTSVTIPEGVTSIESNTFRDCTSLTSVTIPSSVTTIGDGAFQGCSALTSVVIPSGVTSIGISAFDDCASLTSATIPSNVTIIQQSTFRRCSSLTSVTIPLGVTDISNKAFLGCSGLTSVTIPSNVTDIGYQAFFGCSGLTLVTIEGRPNIRDAAFANCPELSDVYCYSETPPSVTSYTFYGSYIEYASLHVPAEYIDKYKNDSFWGNSFKEIVAIDPNSVVLPNVERDSPVVYDLNGRRVAHPTSGLYIINGKKTCVK